MNEILVSLPAVLENTASTGTDAEGMAKYSSASLLSIGMETVWSVAARRLTVQCQNWRIVMYTVSTKKVTP